MTGILLKYVQEKNSGRYLLVSNTGSTYTISEMLYNILYRKQQNMGNKEIAAEMNLLSGTDRFTEPFIQATIENILDRVSGQKASSQAKGQQYIFLKQTILTAGNALAAYEILSRLFRKNTLALLTCLSAIATISFFCSASSNVFSAGLHQAITGLGPGKTAVLYGLILLIVLLHELGHASAAYRFGIMPDEIGFGMYFIFPVLYTNVTGIWGLPARQRIVVNLGGIYFQLLANLPLLFLFHTGIYTKECILLVTANTIGMLSSLNPFLRYDGYWIFSDAFNIPNLQTRAWGLYMDLLKGKLPTKNASRALVLYAFLKAIFWMAIFFCCINFFNDSINKVQYLIATQRDSEHTLAAIRLSTISFLVLFFIPLKLMWAIIKNKQHVSK